MHYVMKLEIAAVMVVSSAQAAEIVHDTEFLVLEAQNAQKWAEDDKVVDQKLAEFKKRNGGNN